MQVTVKKEFYKEESSKIFTQIIEIIGSDFSFYFINDNLQLSLNNKIYEPKSFKFTPPDSLAEDSNSTLEIDDLEKVLTYNLQRSENQIDVKIGLIDRDNPDIFIDGPYTYKISNVRIPFNSQITIELTSNNIFSYKIGNSSYNNISFPGLFG